MTFSGVLGPVNIFFSYVPLMRGAEPEGGLEGLADYPTGRASHCVWGSDILSTSVVFVLHRAREIRSHLLEWSDGAPEEWFDLEVSDSESGYGVALVPRARKSVERHILKSGLSAEPDDYQVILRPIHFRSASRSPAFDFVYPLVGDRCDVMFLDGAGLDGDGLASSLWKAESVGSFRVIRDGIFARCL